VSDSRPLYADRRPSGIRLPTDLSQNIDVLGCSPAAWHRFASHVIAKALHPPDGGTDADVELFSRFTAGTSCFNKADDAPSQFTRYGPRIG
jgi:hypothetical protein